MSELSSSGWAADCVDRLHRQAWEWSRKARFIDWEAVAEKDSRRALAREVERLVADRLRSMGFCVRKARHNEHFDLLAWREGLPGALRVEVKASRWQGGRYGAALRSNRADVLVWCCRNGSDNWLVIPWAEVADRRYLKVSSEDVAEYGGQWAGWLGRWDEVERLAELGQNPWQLPLVGLEVGNG